MLSRNDCDVDRVREGPLRWTTRPGSRRAGLVPEDVARSRRVELADESLNSQLRKFLRGQGPLPNDQAVLKLSYLGAKNAKPLINN